MYPIITKEIQKEFEAACNGVAPEDLPIICGVYGRACRQMEKEEGANCMSCTHCLLAEFTDGKSNGF